MQTSKQSLSLLAHPFRPFFILNALFAIVAIVVWLLILNGTLPTPKWMPSLWHAHEMLYGFVPLAIAGFVLTAMTNWTKSQPLRGLPLAGLISLWFAGRVAMALTHSLSPIIIAVIDCTFLPTVAAYAAYVLLKNNNKRNLILVVVMLLLTLGNFLMHLGVMQNNYQLAKMGTLLGLDIIVLMIFVVAGRITPAFTANWLRMHHNKKEPAFRSFWLEQVAFASTALIILFDAAALSPAIIGSTALFAGIANVIRLTQWAGWRTYQEPLLWILHIAYLWMSTALILRGAMLLGLPISESLWQHTLALGGIGTLILGVMTRVSMGHTGRKLMLPPFAIFIYIFILSATLMRIITAAGWVNYSIGINISGALWISAFALFVILYSKILVTPRADGKAG